MMSLSGFYFAVWIVLTLAALFHLLIHKREPTSTLSWGLFVMLVPVLGSLIYFTLGPERLVRQVARRRRLLSENLYLKFNGPTRPHSLTPPLETFFTLTQKLSRFPPTTGNQVTLLSDPSQALQTILQAIHSAQTFIHMEYYIISSDAITDLIFQALIQARARGVEVRILYDAVGSLALKSVHFKQLKEAGIEISGFLPFSLFPQRLHFNFRNHRKILLVDGKQAFTGGTNLGREYLGLPGDHQWRDFTIQVWGPACLQLEEVFREDWKFTTQQDLSHSKYYPPPNPEGKVTIQVMESGPDSAFRTLHQTFFGAINLAQKQISLMTPYFIPDNAILTALEVAALKGVEIRLVLPQKNDQWVVKLASRSFYHELLRAGVQIAEFEPKILHAKMMTIDQDITVMGSGNMDMRSFRLNFEITLVIQDEALTQQAQALFNQDLAKSRPIHLEAFSQRGLLTELSENTARMLTPVL